jgi:hypothetical protein
VLGPTGPAMGQLLQLRALRFGFFQDGDVGSRTSTQCRADVAVVNCAQDIEDEEAMSFFGGPEGDADESQG